MTLSKNDRCRLAERLAREAGALGLDYFTDLKTLQVDRKGHQDLVSEADKALEKHIRSGIAAAFPQDGILGEEDGYEAGENDYVWVIDPIDGTANFVSGIPAWTVVIALVEKSRVIAGFIYEPAMEVMYTGFDGEGAFRNGARMSVADTPISPPVPWPSVFPIAASPPSSRRSCRRSWPRAACSSGTRQARYPSPMSRMVV